MSIFNCPFESCGNCTTIVCWEEKESIKVFTLEIQSPKSDHLIYSRITIWKHILLVEFLLSYTEINLLINNKTTVTIAINTSIVVDEASADDTIRRKMIRV